MVGSVSLPERVIFWVAVDKKTRKPIVALESMDDLPKKGNWLVQVELIWESEDPDAPPIGSNMSDA